MARKNNKILFLVFFTVFLNSTGITIVIPVIAMLFLSDTHQVFGQNMSFATIMLVLGFLKASYPVFQFVGAPLLGSLSDKIGRKKVLIYSLFGTLAGFVLFIIGIIYQDLFLLFLGRSIDGFTGGNISIVNSSVADISKKEAKTKNFGLVGMAFGTGFIFGPFIGGVASNHELSPLFSFITPFILASFLVLVNIILIYFFFPETYSHKGKELVKISTVKSNFSIFSTYKNIRFLLVTVFLFILGFTFYTQFYDVYLKEKYDYNQFDIGLIFAYIGIWIVVSQGFICRIVSKYIGARPVVSISLLLLAVSIFILIFPDSSSTLYLILPFVSVMHGLVNPNLTSLISNSVPDHAQGKVLGINQSFQSLGLAIPPIISGFVISININFPLVFSAIMVLIAWLIFVFSKKVF